MVRLSSTLTPELSGLPIRFVYIALSTVRSPVIEISLSISITLLPSPCIRLISRLPCTSKSLCAFTRCPSLSIELSRVCIVLPVISILSSILSASVIPYPVRVVGVSASTVHGIFPSTPLTNMVLSSANTEPLMSPINFPSAIISFSESMLPSTCIESLKNTTLLSGFKISSTSSVCKLSIGATILLFSASISSVLSFEKILPDK